jgi:hypothetical protein
MLVLTIKGEQLPALSHPQLYLGERRLVLRHPQQLRRIFSFPVGSHDEVVKEGRSETGRNGLLLVILACCTLGLFCYKDGWWQPTRLGYMIALLGPLADPVEIIRNFPFTEGEVTDSRLWAKKVICDPKNRAILNKFFSKGTGWRPDQLGVLGEKESAIRVCAALVTLRMAWFSGYDFAPTLFGQWFEASPDSELNKN